jgi:hypothetical protein
MADAIGYHYNTTKSLSVIYNSFPIKMNKSISTRKIHNSMIWFSQTIGTGRGIEAFMELMKKVSVPVELHFVGYSSLSYTNFLNDFLKGTPHILHVHPPMEHNEMLQLVAQFEFGLALENTYPQSRDLTITNKILVYLQLGLRVIATPTQGHLELQQQFPRSITYIQQNDEVNSVEAIDQLLSVNPLQEAQDMGHYAWIEQEKTILALVHKAIQS